MEQVKLEVVLGEGAETGGNTENFVFAVMPKIDETVPTAAHTRQSRHQSH